MPDIIILLTPEIIESQNVDAIPTSSVWKDLETLYQDKFKDLLLRNGKSPDFPDSTERKYVLS